MRASSALRWTFRIAKRVASRGVALIRSPLARQHGGSVGAKVLASNVSEFFAPQSNRESHRSDGPIFTVLIPTMDRAGTLIDTIRTCLAQNDTNFRIIVSDNASEDNTAEVVKAFADARLSYINPRRRLGMSEHWEFALAHVQGGYVTILGDDDGLLPGAVSAARQMIQKYELHALSWQKVEYCWPDHIVPSFQNWLQVPLAAELNRMSSRDAVRSVVQFREGYTRLPCIYNSFVSTRLIRSFQEKNGGIFFSGSIPDICSAFAIASEVSEFAFCSRPLSINGAGGKSNGTRQIVGNKDDGLAKSFWTDTKFTFEPGIPQVPIIEFCVIDSFLKVQKVATSFSRDLIDVRQLILSAVDGTFSGHIPESRRADRLQALKEYARTEGLLELFEETQERARTGERQGLPKPGYYGPDSVVFDASSMGIDNVYSAALRVAEILDLKARQGALFQQLVESHRGDIAIALFVRSNSSSLCTERRSSTAQ